MSLNESVEIKAHLKILKFSSTFSLETSILFGDEPIMAPVFDWIVFSRPKWAPQPCKAISLGMKNRYGRRELFLNSGNSCS